MMCANCGFDNYPAEAECRRCQGVLLEGEALAEARRRWEALSPILRAEMEKEIGKKQSLYREYREYLRAGRRRHIVQGALLCGLTRILSHGLMLASGENLLISTIGALPHFALGGVAGHLLNRGGGGRYWGLAYFTGAFLAGLAAELLLWIGPVAAVIASSVDIWGVGNWSKVFYFPILAANFLAIEIVGVFFGIHLDQSNDFWRTRLTIPPEERDGGKG